MSVLSDRAIKAALTSGRLGIAPLTDPDEQIQPASVDLRLGAFYHRFQIPRNAFGDNHIRIHEIDTYTSTEYEATDGETIWIPPQTFILGVTQERITMPPDLVGRIDGRSSVGRLGLLIHVTAGFVDPGFDGVLTLELYNLQNRTIELMPGVRICQISFEQLTTAAERPYGALRHSKYGGATIEATKLYLDQEMIR